MSSMLATAVAPPRTLPPALEEDEEEEEEEEEEGTYEVYEVEADAEEEGKIWYFTTTPK